MTNDKFAVFILSHGRPNNVITYNTLRRQGYTGDIYIVVDDEDDTATQYIQRYGDKVVTFSKSEIAKTFDECDNFNINRKSVVYARNACFSIAKALGIHYFLQLDDDYKSFEHRLNANLEYQYSAVKNLDQLFEVVLDYYKAIPALTIALAQGGDLIGGVANTHLKKLALKRKAMNSFLCSIDRPFQFIGRINEDVNTYTSLGHRGQLIFTIYNADVVQMQTQSQSGGMTDIYRANGTYIKSFYTVMNCPSFVKIGAMDTTHTRLHHKIKWDNAVPVIISERHRKPVLGTHHDETTHE